LILTSFTFKYLDFCYLAQLISSSFLITLALRMILQLTLADKIHHHHCHYLASHLKIHNLAHHILHQYQDLHLFQNRHLILLLLLNSLFFLLKILIYFKELLIHQQPFCENLHCYLHFVNHLIIPKFLVHRQFHHECHFLEVFLCFLFLVLSVYCFNEVLKFDSNPDLFQ